MPRKVLYTIITILIIGITSCEEPTQPTNISIDPVFREFYDLLGGEEILGPAISSMYEDKGRKLQFTTAVLLIYDAQAPESSRYQLYAIGNTLNVAEPPLTPTSPNGHEIYPGFLPLFRQLGGTRYTGRPITGVKADPEYHRIVQYFENVGFYQLENDPPDVAHLLDYGVWKCAQACGYSSPDESIVIPPSSPGHGIESAVDRLNPSLTGFPLTEIFIASDGREEQIFENVVIYTDQASPGGIALRPVPGILGIRAEEPVSAGSEDGKFIAVDGNQGFNVPYHFDDYVNRNNGYAFIGKPINHYRQINDDLYRQCFENLCLDYHPDEIEELQIRPMALGRRYKQQIAKEDNGGGTNSFNAVTLTVWERYPVITSAENQEILVMVLDSGNPMKNIDLVLSIYMPDGDHRTLNFPATGGDGQTSLELGSIEASNGTLIAYDVCIANIADAPECISDDFLIWGNP